MSKANSGAIGDSVRASGDNTVCSSLPIGVGRQLTPENLASAVSDENVALAYAALLEDNEAFRTRLEREKSRVVEAERASIAQALLESTDDLERALSAVASVDKDYDQGLRDLTRGVRLSLALLYKRIASLGAERIATTGRHFDPQLAEAVGTVNVSERSQHGIVIDEMRPGYRVGDRLLRAAQVRVGHFAGI